MNKSPLRISFVFAVAAVPLFSASAHAQATTGQTASAIAATAPQAKNAPGQARRLPSSALPILERARAGCEVARRGRAAAAPEARPSYREAENAFSRLLASAGLLRNDAKAAAPGVAAATTEQSAADIRALKSLAKRAPFGEAGFWNRAAELYASGARSLLTAQLRDALFAPSNGNETAMESDRPTVILEGSAER